jgi:hypothetical protein
MKKARRKSASDKSENFQVAGPAIPLSGLNCHGHSAGIENDLGILIEVAARRSYFF